MIRKRSDIEIALCKKIGIPLKGSDCNYCVGGGVSNGILLYFNI